MLFGLTGGGQRGQGSTVEGPHCRNDNMAATTAVFAGKLDERLVGLAARVAEEDFAWGATNEFVDNPGDLPLRLGRKQVAHVQQFRRLLGDGLGDTWVRVPQRGDGDTGQSMYSLPLGSYRRDPSPRTNMTSGGP
jgi:hypothetical protein